MPCRVNITHRAAADLQGIYRYITAHDSAERASYVLDQIEAIFKRLSTLPERGALVRELEALGNDEFRELFFKPYRVIYQVAGEEVFIVLIADGRRDMRGLLQRRLLNQ